eukprot:s500_g7.t1
MTVVLHVIILVILGRSRLRRVWLALNPPQVVVRPVEEMVGNPSCDCSICLQPLLEVQKDEMPRTQDLDYLGECCTPLRSRC